MDMTEMVREHLAQAEEHVAQGECHLAQQREIIAELERDSHDGRASIEMLKQLEQLQALHISDRDHLRAELERLRDPARPITG
jgi:hypothetical protein